MSSCLSCQSINPQFCEEFSNRAFCNTLCQKDFYIGILYDDKTPPEIIILQLKWLSFKDLYVAYQTSKRIRQIILTNRVFLNEWLKSFSRPLTSSSQRDDAAMFIRNVGWDDRKKLLVSYILLNDGEPILESTEYALQFPVFDPYRNNNAVFRQAIKLGYTSIVERLMGNIGLSANDYEYMYSASIYGHVGVFKLLFNPNVRRVDQIFANIVRNNHTEIVRFLMDKNVRPSLALQDYMFGIASGSGNLEMINLLIEFKTASAIISAATNGHLRMVKYLFDVKNTEANKDALAFAAAGGHLEIVNFLLDQNVDPSERQNFGIKNAALNGHLEIVKRLLEVVDPYLDNNYLIKYAAWRRDQRIVAYFLDNYVYTEDVFEDLMDIANTVGDQEFLKFLKRAIERSQGRGKRFKILNKISI